MFIAKNRVESLELVAIGETAEEAIEAIRDAIAKVPGASEKDVFIAVAEVDVGKVVFESAWMDADEVEAEDPRLYPGEEMDGDFDSAMASAGFGTDEDYGYDGGDGFCE